MHVTHPIDVAPESPFPITNIPFGVFSTQEQPVARVGVAIGEYVLDLSHLEEYGLFKECFKSNEIGSNHVSNSLSSTKLSFSQSSLNDFASFSTSTRSSVRSKIISLLLDANSAIFEDSKLNKASFHKRNETQMHLPFQIGDFTDFMCSRTHVDNCSRMAGATTPPNFRAFPTAYNGRVSSVVPSGTSIKRPRGMLRVPGTSNFEIGPSRRMDYELEMGFFVSTRIPFGTTIKSADQAKDHIFGFVLLNDWSARDIQFAEMTPLGPFNGKGCGTTISPWVVTLDALEDVQIPCSDFEALEKMAERPNHLKHEGKNQTWNIGVEVGLRRRGKGYERVAEANLGDLYWSPAQMLSHHASSGCGLNTGDLLGTGTLSSPERGDKTISSLGCLHEVTKGGIEPLVLGNGETVTWLEDWDEVILTGKVVKSGGNVIGFGECSGILESASTD